MCQSGYVPWKRGHSCTHSCTPSVLQAQLAPAAGRAFLQNANAAKLEYQEWVVHNACCVRVQKVYRGYRVRARLAAEALYVVTRLLSLCSAHLMRDAAYLVACEQREAAPVVVGENHTMAASYHRSVAHRDRQGWAAAARCGGSSWGETPAVVAGGVEPYSWPSALHPHTQSVWRMALGLRKMLRVKADLQRVNMKGFAISRCKALFKGMYTRRRHPEVRSPAVVLCCCWCVRSNVRRIST